MTADTQPTDRREMLTYRTLRDAVSGSANYLRFKTPLQPADGPGGKVHPPTYQGPEGSARNEESRYHIEERRLYNSTVLAAVLDSVQSQANRAEIALLDAYADGLITIPLLQIDFTTETGEADYDGVLPGVLTSLEASHRAADAVFRECQLDGVFFRESPVGRGIFGASERDAADMYRYCPTALIFGQWDSMGADARRGHKFERRVVSEIVAVNVVVGRGSSSKLDPLMMEGSTVYANAAYPDDPTAAPWTTDKDQAALDRRGRPVLHGAKKESRGKMSGLGLGNVTPSVSARPRRELTGHGGVTFEYAEQTTVIALNGIRKLRFPRHRKATVYARTALAALALAASVLRDVQGYDLRSRCLLVPSAPPTVELVDPYGRTQAFDPVTAPAAAEILTAAADAAAEAGLAWETEPVVLTPADSFRYAVRSRRSYIPDHGS